MEHLIEQQSVIIFLLLVGLAEIMYCVIAVMHWTTRRDINEAKNALERDIREAKNALMTDIRTYHYELLSEIRQSRMDHNAVVRDIGLQSTRQVHELEERLRRTAIRN